MTAIEVMSRISQGISMELNNDIKDMGNLGRELVNEIKYITKKRLELVESQLDEIIDTAKKLENRGYQPGEKERSKFLFELRTELIHKKMRLEEQVACKDKVDNEELDFFLKLQESDNS